MYHSRVPEPSLVGSPFTLNATLVAPDGSNLAGAVGFFLDFSALGRGHNRQQLPHRLPSRVQLLRQAYASGSLARELFAWSDHFHGTHTILGLPTSLTFSNGSYLRGRPAGDFQLRSSTSVAAPVPATGLLRGRCGRRQGRNSGISPLRSDDKTVHFSSRDDLSVMLGLGDFGGGGEEAPEIESVGVDEEELEDGGEEAGGEAVSAGEQDVEEPDVDDDGREQGEA